MPKLNARIVFTVLISLGVILAVAANVPGKLGLNSGANSAQASVSGRVNVSARAGTFTQFESVSPDSGHECGSFSDPYADD